ncbi:MAG: hypothetical protein J6Y89_10815, partial [Lachnospiraceae bacterium]|nr:hypothetical protein [Lachnospiraceae bacterium]
MSRKNNNYDIIVNVNKKDKRNGEPHLIFYFLLLVLYCTAIFFLTRVSRIEGVIVLADRAIPYQTFTGVFSSLANICTIFLVVYFRKLGFITALVLALAQYPVMIVQFIVQSNPSGIPGMFSNSFILFTVFLLNNRNKAIEKYQKVEVDNLKTQQKFALHLFEQTATTLVNAIDAKDTYSHGHSLRVAEYSERIAREAGKSEEDCRKIYYAA